jgi:hypothetical protein
VLGLYLIRFAEVTFLTISELYFIRASGSQDADRYVVIVSSSFDLRADMII